MSGLQHTAAQEAKTFIAILQQKEN